MVGWRDGAELPVSLHGSFREETSRMYWFLSAWEQSQS